MLGHVRERAPWADLVYVADHAFGAYGERSLDEVRARTELLARYLVSAGIEEIVIACNSASAAALHHLRDVLPDMLFVGMEPAIKPAAEKTRNRVVGVLATEATFQGQLFRSLVGRHASNLTVIEQACPGLAAAIERGDQVDELLDEHLMAVIDGGADVVVLGCTHYSLISQQIDDRLGAGTIIVDPSSAVATQVLDIAHDAGIDLKGTGLTRYWTTNLETDRGDHLLWESIDIPANASHAVRVAETTMVALQGDITSMPVSAVVNAANESLVHGGGVALAISDAAGPSIDKESQEWIRTYGQIVSGVAALTSAGAMPSSYVIHVAGPVYQPDQENEKLLAASVFAALETATEIGAESVAMPAISAGTCGYPSDDATRVIAASVAEFVDTAGTSIRSVRLVGHDTAMTGRFVTAISSLL